MKSLLLPLLLAVFGTGTGIGAAKFLETGKTPETVADCPVPEDHDENVAEGTDLEADHAVEEKMRDAEKLPAEYVKISNQFFVPVVENERVTATVILSINLEVAPGGSDLVFSQEPRLRAAFLQVLFDHANTGHFGVGYTNTASLDLLRRNLLTVAQRYSDNQVRRILITEIARQAA
ncbi:flagellar basal body-associated protein FliL [Roseivivax sp. CAU 1753]